MNRSEWSGWIEVAGMQLKSSLCFTERTLLLGLWSKHLSMRGDVVRTQRREEKKGTISGTFFFFVSKSLLKCRYLPVCCICRWSHVFSATQPWQTEICLIRLWGLLSFCQAFQGLTLHLLSSRLLSPPPPNTCPRFSLFWTILQQLLDLSVFQSELISLSPFQLNLLTPFGDGM